MYLPFKENPRQLFFVKRIRWSCCPLWTCVFSLRSFQEYYIMFYCIQIKLQACQRYLITSKHIFELWLTWCILSLNLFWKQVRVYCICFYAFHSSFLLFISILQRHALCSFTVKSVKRHHFAIYLPFTEPSIHICFYQIESSLVLFIWAFSEYILYVSLLIEALWSFILLFLTFFKPFTYLLENMFNKHFCVKSAKAENFCVANATSLHYLMW